MLLQPIVLKGINLCEVSCPLDDCCSNRPLISRIPCAPSLMVQFCEAFYSVMRNRFNCRGLSSRYILTSEKHPIIILNRQIYFLLALTSYFYSLQRKYQTKVKTLTTQSHAMPVPDHTDQVKEPMAVFRYTVCTSIFVIWTST